MWLILYSPELHTDDENVTRKVLIWNWTLQKAIKSGMAAIICLGYVRRYQLLFAIGYSDAWLLYHKQNKLWIYKLQFMHRALCVCKEAKSMSSLWVARHRNDFPSTCWSTNITLQLKAQFFCLHCERESVQLWEYSQIVPP